MTPQDRLTLFVAGFLTAELLPFVLVGIWIGLKWLAAHRPRRRVRRATLTLVRTERWPAWADYR